MSTYREPLEKFLKLGKPDTHQEKDWLNYIKEYELKEEHIPDLIEMVLDNSTDEFIEPDSYAAIHAWRSLGQLQATEAIDALIEVIKRNVWEDWGWEEVPEVLSMIGEPAIEPLRKTLAETARDYSFHPTIFESALRYTARRHADLKERILEIIVNQLRDAANNDRTLNGFLVANLLDFKHEAALPVIETAYKLSYVDTGICGKWYDVQVEFGVKNPEVFESDSDYSSFNNAFGFIKGDVSQDVQSTKNDTSMPSSSRIQSKKKKKRKMAQKSRKQNRKKKKKKK